MWDVTLHLWDWEKVLSLVGIGEMEQVWLQEERNTENVHQEWVKLKMYLPLDQ